MPAPREPAVGDGDHLLVRVVKGRQQHQGAGGPGDEHPEDGRRLQVRRRAEVEVEPGPARRASRTGWPRTRGTRRRREPSPGRSPPRPPTAENHIRAPDRSRSRSATSRSRDPSSARSSRTPSGRFAVVPELDHRPRPQSTFATRNLRTRSAVFLSQTWNDGLRRRHHGSTRGNIGHERVEVGEHCIERRQTGGEVTVQLDPPRLDEFGERRVERHHRHEVGRVRAAPRRRQPAGGRAG